MRKSFYYFTVFILMLACRSCITSKRSTDTANINYITRHPERIKEMAIFSIRETYDKKIKEFATTNVTDPSIRKSMQDLGNTVIVAYNDNAYGYEIPDSIVTFKSITLFGVTEIIYDFAVRERHFENSTSNRREYYFIKAADRIYYRRRPVPMM